MLHTVLHERLEVALKCAQKSKSGRKQGIEIVLDEKDSHESAIGFLTILKEAREPAVVVEPAG